MKKRKWSPVEFEAKYWEGLKKTGPTIAYDERSRAGRYETLNPAELERDPAGAVVLTYST